MPSSVHTITIEDLTEELVKFKTDLKGKELEPNCEGGASSINPADMGGIIGGDSIVSREDRAFFKYVDSMEGNSCGMDNRPAVTPSQNSETSPEDCKVEKVDGYLDEVITQIMQDEKDKKEVRTVTLQNSRMQEFYDKASLLKAEVIKYLDDGDIENAVKVELLVEYLGDVALPMRDFVVVLRGYMPGDVDGVHFYESLLLEIDTDLYGDDELLKDRIQAGPNKMVENFHLVIDEGLWGKAQLKYHPTEILSRDIVQILRAPTTKNYIRATKWMTLQMMITQIFTYDAMIGETKPLEIPRACQNHFTGNLPESIEMQFNEEEGDAFLNRILAGHGLIMSEGDTQYAEYYLDNINKDPTLEGYSGLMPFENYKAASVGLDGEKSRFLEPAFDDFSSFEETKGIILSKGLGVFNKTNRYLFGLIDLADTNYYGAQLMAELFSQPDVSEIYEFDTDDGETIEIEHVRQNLSTYLTKSMQRHKVDYWEDLITSELEAELKNNVIQFNFPSLHGATVWRMWALGQLEDFVNKYIGSEIPRGVESALFRGIGGSSHKLAEGRSTEEVLLSLKNYLNELKVGDQFTPTRRLTTGDHVEGYRVLGRIWESLILTTQELPEARTNEYDYLINQMDIGNPWARVRVGYLVLQNELQNISEGRLPDYSNTNMSEFNGETINSCKQRDVSTISEKVRRAAYKMGISRRLVPNYATYLLDKGEKEYLWSQTVNEASPLFKQRDTDGKRFYEKLEQTSYQTFLEEKDIVSFVENNIHGDLHEKAWKEINDYLETEEGKIGSFYTELYKMKGDPEAQFEFFREHALENGINNQYEAKLGFLFRDNLFKGSIFKSLLRSSANLRKNEIYGNLETFCNLEPNDHEQMRTLYFASSKAQNQLNQLTGAPTIPDDVMKKIDKKVNGMSKDDWIDVGLGVGSAFLGITAMLVGGACTGLTGGFCAPLGMAMFAAGASAFTMQATLIGREVGRKLEANHNSGYLAELEELGFSDHGSAEKMARSWFWAGFETIAIIPLIGVTARSLSVGAELSVVSSAMMARNIGAVGFREAWRMTGEAGQAIVAKGDVRLARIVLGFDSIGAQSAAVINSLKKIGGATARTVEMLAKAPVDRRVLQRASERLKNLKAMFDAGQLSPFAFAKRVGQVLERLKRATREAATRGMVYNSGAIVKETPEQIDHALAKTVAEYFAGNPKGMQHLMKSYVKRIPRSLKAVERYDGGTSLLSKLTLAPWIRNGISAFRGRHLAKHADDIIRIERELGELASRNGNLEQYVLENIDLLTDIFRKIPVRRQEIPYMGLFQGGIHVGKGITSIGGFVNRVGGHRFSNGLVMKKFFEARTRLISETYKAEMRRALNLPAAVAYENVYDVFQSFQESLARTADSLTEEGRTTLTRQYENLENQLFGKIKEVLDQKTLEPSSLEAFKRFFRSHRSKMTVDAGQLSEEALKKIIFNPETVMEKSMARVLWSSVNVNDLFDLNDLDIAAHRALQELANYKSADDFEHYLNAMKILVIKRDLDRVDVM